MKGCLFFVTAVVIGILSHKDRECKKITKGCLSLEEDQFQFGLWLRAIALKISHKKNDFHHSKPGENDEDVLIVFDKDESEPKISLSPH